MKVLLDTHALLWWLWGDERLSRRAQAAIGAADTEVFVSAASAFEISIKVRIGKLPAADRLSKNFAATLAEQGFTPLAVSAAHALHAGAMPGKHRDPFDRLLAAQSMLEGLPLVTDDALLKKFHVDALW